MLAEHEPDNLPPPRKSNTLQPRTVPPDGTTWKLNNQQIHAAARAIARMDDKEWSRLPAVTQEDFLIDGHNAIVAAARIATIPAQPAKGVVCMSREHAEAYHELFKITERMEKYVTDNIKKVISDEEYRPLISQTYFDRDIILNKIRSFAAPESPQAAG